MACPFCDFEKQIKYRLLEESKHLWVIPDLGSFIPGYLLVVSKEHVQNMGLLPPEAVAELHILIKKARAFLRENFQAEIILFEHGPSCVSSKRGGSCVDHFHLAVVATNKNVFPAIQAQLGQPETITDYIALAQMQQTGEADSYLLFESRDQKYVWKNPKIASQYVRRLLAPSSNPKIFNWRLHPFQENVGKTVKAWREWQAKKNNL